MPTPAKASFKLPTAWSFSRWMDYSTCPAKFKYKHLMKIEEPPNAAMDRGNKIHKLAEKWTKKDPEIKKLPPELKLFKKEFEMLRKHPLKFVEEQWTFTKGWGITTWNNWAEAWLRMKCDVAYVNTEHNALVPIDHKTGSMRDEKKAEYEMQLELQALGGFLQQPEIEIVSPRLWYLDHGVIYPDPTEREVEYTRDDIPRMKKTWLMRVEPMFRDKMFNPKQNSTCGWCFYRKSNGGPCKFN